MKYDSICSNDKIHKLLPHQCLRFEEALDLAFLKISKNEVVSTWMDAWLIDKKSPDIAAFSEIPSEGCFTEVKKMNIRDSKEATIDRIWSLGGDKGWYGVNWAWRLRGLIDKMVHGPGMNRGRRHPTDLQVGDAIDFWRVVKAEKKEGHLILYAQMHLPGEGWLEFKVRENVLYQIIVFQPKGILGRLYWHAMLPFHFFIFKKLVKGLAGW